MNNTWILVDTLEHTHIRHIFTYRHLCICRKCMHTCECMYICTRTYVHRHAYMHTAMLTHISCQCEDPGRESSLMLSQKCDFLNLLPMPCNAPDFLATTSPAHCGMVVCLFMMERPGNRCSLIQMGKVLPCGWMAPACPCSLGMLLVHFS